MGFNLRQLPIRSKLRLLVAACLVPTLILQVLTMLELRQKMLDDRKLKTQHLVQSAHSVLQHFGLLEQDGALTKKDAQTMALSVIESMRYANDQYFWINDKVPRILMHAAKPELNNTDASNIADPNGKHLFVEMVNISANTGEGFLDYQWSRPGSEHPIDKVSYVKRYEPWGWIVGSGIYVDDVQDAFIQEVLRISLWLGLVLMAVIFLCSRIASSLVKPASALSLFLKDLAEHKDVSKRTEITGDDELGHMGQAVNYMLQSFQSSLQDICNSVEKVAVAAAQLSSVSNQTSCDINKQYSEIQTVAAAMEQMSATVNEVSRNTNQTASATEDTRSAANQSYQRVQEATKSIGELASNIQSASDVIQGLEKDTHNIGAILDVIRGISEQTNLLALNAAIEAARAGEQGRGFAVVSDEVRTLSQRTQDSVAEIEDMIRRLQSGSHNAVKVMERSTSAADNSVNQVADVAAALTTINTTMNTISDMSTQIAAASEEQSAVANEINNNINAISSVAESTSQGASQSASSSHALSQLAVDLRAITQRFRF